MSEELLLRLLCLGIPFVVALFIPNTTKEKVDAEVDAEFRKKFGG
jgi:hypothetical protein